MRPSNKYRVRIERLPHRHAVQRMRKIYALLHHKIDGKVNPVNPAAKETVQEKVK